VPKKTRLKIALVAFLLTACGTIAVLVLHADPRAAASPENRRLDKLLGGMGVEVLPSRMSPVEVLLQNLNGADVNISDFRGKILFLNFWATWCPTCVAEMPAMEKLHQALKNKDFALVTVSIQESAAEVKRFLKQNQLTFTALLDPTGKTVPGFGLRAIPTTLILDKTGRIVGRVMGPRPWDSRESIAMFKQLIDEPLADSKESRSM